MEHHITVLKKEAVDALQIQPGDTIVDATIGSLGHTREILSRLHGEGTFVGIDRDEAAIAKAGETLAEAGLTIHLRTGNFRDIDQLLNELEIRGADGILVDLGWRIEQFEGGGKGFSFQSDEPLLMTYGDPKEYPFTAGDIVNSWKEEDIKNVIKGYGEERFSGRIASAIVKARQIHTITTARELAEIITSSVPGSYRRGKVDPATRTFQALRIAVNDELEALEEFIEKSIPFLKEGGRLAIITFHSLEDRIVKLAFRKLADEGKGKIVTKKPIRPESTEVEENPRARSAKLRVFEKYEEAK